MTTRTPPPNLMCTQCCRGGFTTGTADVISVESPQKAISFRCQSSHSPRDSRTGRDGERSKSGKVEIRQVGTIFPSSGAMLENAYLHTANYLCLVSFEFHPLVTPWAQLCIGSPAWALPLPGANAYWAMPLCILNALLSGPRVVGHPAPQAMAQMSPSGCGTWQNIYSNPLQTVRAMVTILTM
jgi:hypothetical protein